MIKHGPLTLAAASCGIITLLASATLGRPAAADDRRRLEERLSARGVRTVVIDVPVGELRIEGSGEEEVAASAEIDCSSEGRHCREKAQRVDLSLERAGGELRIGLAGWPDGAAAKGLALEMRVWMPRALAVSSHLGVGELRVDGVTGDLTATVGVGEVEVVRPEAGVRRVKVDVGVGGASLSVGRREIAGSGFLGRSIDWKGDGGPSEVEVDCGVGEVAIRLE